MHLHGSFRHPLRDGGAGGVPPSKSVDRPDPQRGDVRGGPLAAPANPSALLILAIALGVHNPAALDALIAAASDPHGPSYGHYLTHAQYLDTYAPTEAEAQAVRDWATAAGLSVTQVSPDRQLVLVAGATRQVETALGVTINTYQLPDQDGQPGRAFRANDRDPVAPADLDIRAISGLSTFDQFRAFASTRSRGQSPRRARTGARPHDARPGGYYPNDFRTAYNVGPVGNGAGQTVGFTLWGAPLAQDDLNGFAANTGATAVTVSGTGADGIEVIPSTAAAPTPMNWGRRRWTWRLPMAWPPASI